MFYVAIMLVSFGAGGCTSVVTMTAVANWFQKNIGMALGVMASGYGASGLMVPVVVWLIDAYGWRTTVVILGIGLWLIGIPLTFIISDKKSSADHNALEQTPNEPSSQPKKSSAHEPVGFIAALKDRNFFYLCLVEMIRMIAVGAIITHIMPYLSSLGFERTTAGFLAASVPIISIIGRFGFGRLGDVIDKKYVMIWTFTLMGMGLLALIYAEFRIAAICFIVLFSPGFGGGVVMRGAILREYFGLIAFGRLLGIVLGAGSIGLIIGPTLAGWCYDTFNRYEPIWLVLTLFLAGAVFLVMKIRK
jgi:MFS family permease